MSTIYAVPAVKRDQLHDLGNGKVSITYPRGSNTFLSIQPDGSWQTRTAVGAWESFEDQGDRAVVADSAYPSAYAVPVVD